jgi:hypothetical protein
MAPSDIERRLSEMREALRHECEAAKRDAYAKTEEVARDARSKAEAIERDARLTREEFVTFRAQVKVWGMALALLAPPFFQFLISLLNRFLQGND